MKGLFIFAVVFLIALSSVTAISDAEELELNFFDRIIFSLFSVNEDSDGDGILDLQDNCNDFPNSPLLGTCYNNYTNDISIVGETCTNNSQCDSGFYCSMNQENMEGDSYGDVCDICVMDSENGDGDYDGYCAYNDVCFYYYNPDQNDSDGDCSGPNPLLGTIPVEYGKLSCGDLCDPCPDDFMNDEDGDLICAGEGYSWGKVNPLDNTGEVINPTGDNDNCPTVYNPDQNDVNSNGVGDVCEDSDADGAFDSVDNCPLVYNPTQADEDSDGVGDVCDPCLGNIINDDDNDGLCGYVDNCDYVWNPTQEDSDGDGLGNVCDICIYDSQNDADNDGICEIDDNCDVTYNPNQEDDDNDGIGSFCDSCPYDSKNDRDSDGVCGNVDNCPTVYNPLQNDTDSDSYGDACDPCVYDSQNDADNDGICEIDDNCETLFNPYQKDNNSNGLGDICDDDDNDGILGFQDNCFFTYNPSQLDLNNNCVLDWYYSEYGFFIVNPYCGDACNVAPSLDISSLPNLAVNVDENGLVQFGLEGTDANLDPLTFGIEQGILPSEFTFDGVTGSFAWNPTYQDSGEYNVVFSVTDGVLTDEEIVTITVDEVYVAPQLLSFDSIEVSEMGYVRIAPNVVNPGEYPLMFSIDSEDFLWDPIYQVFKWAPDALDSGEYDFTISVTDGMTNDQETIHVTILNKCVDFDKINWCWIGCDCVEKLSFKTVESNAAFL